MEKEYADKLPGLMEEKAKLEAQLIQQEEMLKAKDREKEEFIAKLETYTNQINELKDKLTLQESEKEKDYTEELSILREEKSAFETQLKTSQDLLSEKDNAITLFKQQKEESEKNLTDQDKMIAELSENIKGYENQITEVKAQMAKEGKEKEVEFANRLSLLSEEKSKLEAQLKTSQDLLLEKDNAITLFKQQKEESEKNLTDSKKKNQKRISPTRIK